MVDAPGSGRLEVRNSDSAAATARPIDVVLCSSRIVLCMASEVFLLGIDGSKSEKNLRRQTRVSEGREAYWIENGKDVSR
jgi:hypothetical protein